MELKQPYDSIDRSMGENKKAQICPFSLVVGSRSSPDLGDGRASCEAGHTWTSHGAPDWAGQKVTILGLVLRLT